MKNISQPLGTLFITISLLSFLYIYLPILKLEFAYRFQPAAAPITLPASPQFGLVIDKLGINQPVVAQVDPFDPQAYLPVLKTAVAHARTSALPGQPGNIFLFAHSSDNPLAITRYNTSFYLLDKLQPGDQIKLYYQSTPFLYQVAETKIVSPGDIAALAAATDTSQLTLQTCYPVGTSLKRLLVIARQQPDGGTD